MDSTRHYVRCVAEKVILKKFILAFKRRLAEHGANVRLPDAVTRADLESGRSGWSRIVLQNYRDVLLDDLSPRLYQRIQTIFQDELRPIPMEVYVVLKSRGRAVKLREIQALDNLITTRPRPYTEQQA